MVDWFVGWAQLLQKFASRGSGVLQRMQGGSGGRGNSLQQIMQYLDRERYSVWHLKQLGGPAGGGKPYVGRGGGVHDELSAAEATASGFGGGASEDDESPDVPCVAHGFLSETRRCLDSFHLSQLAAWTWFHMSAPLSLDAMSYNRCLVFHLTWDGDW